MAISKYAFYNTSPYINSDEKRQFFEREYLWFPKNMCKIFYYEAVGENVNYVIDICDKQYIKKQAIKRSSNKGTSKAMRKKRSQLLFYFNVDVN